MAWRWSSRPIVIGRGKLRDARLERLRGDEHRFRGGRMGCVEFVHGAAGLPGVDVVLRPAM